MDRPSGIHCGLTLAPLEVFGVSLGVGEVESLLALKLESASPKADDSCTLTATHMPSPNRYVQPEIVTLDQVRWNFCLFLPGEKA